MALSLVGTSSSPIVNTLDEVSSLGLGKPNFSDLSEAYSGGSSANIGLFLKAICPLKVCILAITEATVWFS